MVIYFVDDALNIVNNKVVNIKMKDILYQGNIINRLKFIEKFDKILKKEKFKSKLFGDKITIVKNAYFNNRDLYYLESIFLEIGFIKVDFINVESLLPDRDATYIEINNSYMVIYLENIIFIDLKIYKDIPKIIKHFKDEIKQDVVLWGTNEHIPQIKVPSLNIYYLENYKSYICDDLLKVKKYGV